MDGLLTSIGIKKLIRSIIANYFIVLPFVVVFKMLEWTPISWGTILISFLCITLLIPFRSKL